MTDNNQAKLEPDNFPASWTPEIIEKFKSAPFLCRMPDYAGDPVPPTPSEEGAVNSGDDE